MLDPNQCPTNPSTLYWTSFSWQLFNWLTTPSLVLPILFVLIALPWGIKPIRRKRRWSGLGIALLVIYLLILTPFTTAVGNRFLVQGVPVDNGATADAIVVLGRGAELRQDRVNVTAQLWQAQRAPLLFASGMGDALEIAELLEKQGIPKSAIDGEPCSRTTEENARFTADRLKPHHVQRMILVTDPPHMLRSLLTFRSLGFEVIPHLSPLPLTLSDQKKGFLVFREYFGLVGYKLQGRLDARNASSSHASRIQQG